MPSENETLVRTAYTAFTRGDVAALLELVHPDLEWTYLDPSDPEPTPRTCHGRGQLKAALGQQAWQDRPTELEEVAGQEDKVLVVVSNPAAVRRRAWASEPRNYLVLTMSQGRVVAMRAFPDRAGARRFTGLEEGNPS
jgi:ketosteroid isomerase-like protein